MPPLRHRIASLPTLVVPPLALLCASCASLHRNADQSDEMRPQAVDPLTGTGQLAVSAFRSTGMAAVRQPFTTIRTGLAVLWHRPREIVTGNVPAEIIPQPQPTEIPGTPEFDKLLDSKGIPLQEQGKVSFLVDGREFFGEVDRQLASTKKTVDVQVFIYDNDDIAVRYSDLFKQKSQEAKVRVLFDDLGSTFAHRAAPETPAPAGFTPPADIASYLKSGSEVRVRRTMNPWLICDHTKLLIFDRRTAILGGMNIGREYYSEWHDLMVKVEGPAVGSLTKQFNRAWRKAGPFGDFALFRKPGEVQRPEKIPDGIPVRLMRTDAARGQRHILNASLLAIRAARKRIWIENPYFAHDETALALAAAARRGVDVRVILPARGDSTIMDVGNLATARDLINAGAKIYRYPRMTHMKVMICDGWAQVGSANLDTLSMRINRELNLAFSDPATVKALENRVFLPDFRASKTIRVEETASPIAPIAEAVADQL
ncbi:phosphatidylserine/phosphatidylglycerophosphate/cardiolipin synthase family protein [Luteolibacter sp. GHJ8]|uniref:Phosphatidylserine/phosphatidylglycerophosphate/ cardiolipin synthase family protein n=1 Tax=Luteolibacter rhizosphaerae TaxID=2989719 RepID=A0ABT3FZX6_9BACT|nr:phosphatidylserine/phosphatidylglycerophosphate/cardiolipin synthase family protein [Luteolibacter rhizosphaerae]MCW1913135.1 phosphatidylserine/phosphatidylglycerophosphate/cardiolipin synthase family protein [Luteolibacter rhizosphaerae]